MFPEITREDVFRLETRRMWLRWPFAADAAAASAVAADAVAADAVAADAVAADAVAAAPELVKALPTRGGAAEDRSGYDATRIERLRRDNTDGRALHLLMTGHGSDRRPFGSISLSPLRERIEDCGLLLRAWLAEERRGSGYTTEAVQAVADAAFMLTDTPLIAASSRVLDPGFRRVLEKCGFAFCGTGLDTTAQDGSLVASDRFRLDRKAWTSLKMWRVPGMVRDRNGAQAGCLA